MANAPVLTGEPAQEAAGLAPGTVVADRYRIVRVLGEGGMGAVYLAEHVHMRKEVAVKVLHKDTLDNPEIVARFEREAIAAGSIAHPNVAQATDFGRLPDGAFFLVLEYVAGRSLRAALDDGAMEPFRALRIVRSIVAAIGAAHAKGIVHRDLKPENVMLVHRDGDPDFVKVLDFGIAKVDARTHGGPASQQPLTRIGAVFGTPDYMAPEQALGEAVDARADLYAVGVMLYELLAGVRPFGGGTVTVLSQRVVRDAPPLPDAVAAAVDPRILAIMKRLLARVAQDRPASAADVLAMIDEVLGASALPGAIPSAPQSIPSAPRSNGASTPAAHAPTVLHSDLDPLPPARSPTRMLAQAALLPTQMAQRAVTAVAPSLAGHVTPARVAATAAVVGFLGAVTVAIALRLALGHAPPPASAPVARGAHEAAAEYAFAVEPPQVAPPPEKAKGGRRRFLWW